MKRGAMKVGVVKVAMKGGSVKGVPWRTVCEGGDMKGECREGIPTS